MYVTGSTDKHPRCVSLFLVTTSWRICQHWSSCSAASDKVKDYLLANVMTKIRCTFQKFDLSGYVSCHLNQSERQRDSRF